MPTNPVHELVQRESGLWVILRRTGSKASVVETGHVDRNLAALDLASYVSSQTLSPIGQGWLKVAQRLAVNLKKGRQRREQRDILGRVDMLRLLMEQGYRCPISGSYFTHDAFDGRTGPFQPSVDRRDASRGYDRDNVRIVCLLVNLAMSNWGEDPLLKIADRIHVRRLAPGLCPDDLGDIEQQARRLRLTSCEIMEIEAANGAGTRDATVSHSQLRREAGNTESFKSKGSN